jgi:hypothetical protein
MNEARFAGRAPAQLIAVSGLGTELVKTMSSWLGMRFKLGVTARTGSASIFTRLGCSVSKLGQHAADFRWLRRG